MYLGLDIGTSGTKAAIINEKGELISFCQKNYGFSNTSGGYRELDAESVFEAVVYCIQKAANGYNIKSITVSALGEAIIPVNGDGKPLMPGIVGTDIRGGDINEEILSKVGEKEAVAITRQNPSHIYSANKIAWLIRNRPDVYEKAFKIFTFQDYCVYRLCKNPVIDYSMAARTFLFDPVLMEWSNVMLSAYGIDAGKLSFPTPSGTKAGIILPDMAELLGVNRDVVITLGTHDHVCNAVGSGVVKAGDCANTVGTTEGLTAVLNPDWLSDEDILSCKISRQPFAVSGLYNTIAWNNTSGVLLRWYARQFAGAGDDHDRLVSIYEDLNKRLPKNPTNLMVLPHFSGAATPHMDPQARGIIAGLTMDTKAIDIYKALMEGTCFELGLIIDSLVASGLLPKKIVATGGALSGELLSIKADILGMPVHTTTFPQTGALGGAMLGAVCVGDFRDLYEAADIMVKEGPVYLPDKERSVFYREKMEVYRDFYNKTKEISHGLKTFGN